MTIIFLKDDRIILLFLKRLFDKGIKLKQLIRNLSYSLSSSNKTKTVNGNFGEMLSIYQAYVNNLISNKVYCTVISFEARHIKFSYSAI